MVIIIRYYFQVLYIANTGLEQTTKSQKYKDIKELYCPLLSRRPHLLGGGGCHGIAVKLYESDIEKIKERYDIVSKKGN